MSSKVQIPSLLEMLKHGVHFGHQTSRWHPKMEPFIFTTRNGVHIINLEKTVQYLERALDFLQKQAASGADILLVATKKQAREMVKKAAEELNLPYVVDKWVGGTFTNFKTIAQLIKKLDKLEAQKEKGEWSRYTKKEQLRLAREYEKLLAKVGGIRTLKKIPDVMFVIDIKEEKTAVAEARKVGVPIVALVDTNANPDLVDYPIPANDDAVRSLELMVGLIKEAIKLGQEEAAKNSSKETQESTEQKQESKK